MVKHKRHQIKETIRRFTEKFNGDDLDGAMEFFAKNSRYVEYNGTQHHGKQTIRKALEPQFRQVFGTVRFHDKAMVIDETEQKAVFNWWCTMEINGKKLTWEGVDLFQFEDGLIKEKRTFAQADMLRFMPRNVLLLPAFMVYIMKQKIKCLFK